MPFTLLGPREFHEEIRRSRFLTLAAPIASAAEAQAFIDQHSDLNASHNCWAWKCGQQYRSSDDGEPGGTAGRPILAAIEAQECDQVVVLVIRWYGGIQLGTGGLARAYGGGAAKCLQNAERTPLVQRVQVACHCLFSEFQPVKQRLVELAAVIEQETFLADGVELLIAVEAEKIQALKQQLADLSRGRIRLQTHA
ncbi:YigZ family protein [Pseudomonas sp. dw_358]|uniref:IMPACT family protein n=1 Tax=Pseudomonas sp. dw_358 TaxID=2720083 RepID=UPI001BD457FA|nr:YigZ family protein [Pseudomonas sp. dw_358]